MVGDSSPSPVYAALTYAEPVDNLGANIDYPG